MKIISNYKDYYDYLQGVYGIDDKIVYERVCMDSPRPKWKGNKMVKPEKGWEKTELYRPRYLDYTGVGKESLGEYYILHVCGTQYHVVINNNKFYFGADIVDFIENSASHMDRYDREMIRDNRFNAKKLHATPTEVNEELNSPVVLGLSNYSRSYIKNVRLSDFGIPSLIPANDMFIKISNFLSREKTIVDNRSDVDKLQSYGFDKVTSFRKM